MTSDTSIILNNSNLNEQSKIEPLLSFTKLQKQKLDERDKTISDMLEKMERDRKKIVNQTKQIEQLRLTLSQTNLNNVSKFEDAQKGEDLCKSIKDLNTSINNDMNTSLQEPKSPRSLAAKNIELMGAVKDLTIKLKYMQGVLNSTNMTLERYTKENADLRNQCDGFKSGLNEVTIQYEELQKSRDADDRIGRIKSDFSEHRVKMTENFEKEKGEWQAEKKKIEDEFNSTKKTLTNQKQRLELSNKALNIGLTTKTNELETLQSEFKEAMQQKQATLQNITAQLIAKEAKLKKSSDELFASKKEVVEFKLKYEEAVQNNETIRGEFVKTEEKYIQLQQQYENIKQFTTVYMNALQKDVQTSVDNSTSALVKQVEFYKAQYKLLKEFLYEIKDVIKSKGPLQTWMNALFPE